MHDHRTGPPAPGRSALRAQRALLLELVVDPPADGDPIDELGPRLGEDPATIEAAIAALAALGLVATRGRRVHATPAARWFEQLDLVRP